MSEPHAPDDTGFQHPSTPETLRRQREAFLGDASACALLDAMPGPAIVLNEDRAVVIVNQHMQRALGASLVQIADGPLPGAVLACVHAAEAPRGCGSTAACALCGANRAILECMRTHGHTTEECRIVTESGAESSALDVRAHASFVQIGGEKFLVLALEDISSEKRRQVLERTFFHDLLNACGGVQGLAELLNEPDNDAASEAELKQDLQRLSHQIIDQIASQRQMLAAERGQLAVAPEAVRLDEFLEEMAATYRHHAVSATRTIEIEGDVPETVRTDRALLARVVSNLVKNALEATPRGGCVRIRAERGPHETRIAVHNPGCMPHHVKLQVFQRSFSTKGGEGRGVGTYSVRMFTEQYLGGRVRFESTEGAGTTFEVTIPNELPDAKAA